MNNHLSPQTVKHKKTTTYGIRNPSPGLIGQTQNYSKIICCNYDVFIQVRVISVKIFDKN